MNRAYSSFVSRLICVPARATDTGQVFLVSSACSRNFASSIPGTSASVFKSMAVILNPLPAGSSFTVAIVLRRLAGCPAFSRLNASAIEKQPASAAPMSSSGFVPFPSSKRDEKEYGPSNAPLPSFVVPLPCLSVPSQTADPVRVAIVLPPVFVADYDSAEHRQTQFLFSLTNSGWFHSCDVNSRTSF